MEVEILLFQIAMKINWREMCFSIMKGNSPFVTKKTIQKPTRGAENTGRGKHGVYWKTQGVEAQGLVGNTGRGKHGFWWEKNLAWKTRGLVKNTGTQWKGKHGVKVKKKKKHGGTIISSNKIKILLF